MRDPGERAAAGAARACGGTLVLTVIAVLAAIKVSRALLFPLVLGLLVVLLLNGPVRWLTQRARLPRGLAATLALAVLLGGLGFGAYSLGDPAKRWWRELPRSLEEVERGLRGVRGSVEEVEDAANKVQEITGGKRTDQVVEVQSKDSPTERVFTLASQAVYGLLVVVIFAFMGLVYGEELVLAAASRLGRRGQRRAAIIARRIETDVSRYLLAITGINLGLGVAVALALYGLGLPNPWLWGAMASILNFVPYLGAAVGVGVVAIVALTQMEPLSAALLPPLAYAGLTTLEGLGLTPILVGRHFFLNPIVLLVSILVWGWLWGVAGVLIAIPLLTVVRILAEEVPGLEAIAHAIGRR